MGWMGEAHSLAYRALPLVFPDALPVRLVACADEDAKRAESCRERFGFAHAFTDWRSAIAAEGVDVVDITLPNRHHLPAIEAAVARGLAVACEKPVGASPAETCRAAKLAREKGVVSMTGYNYRWGARAAKPFLACWKKGGWDACAPYACASSVATPPIRSPPSRGAPIAASARVLSQT